MKDDVCMIGYFEPMPSGHASAPEGAVTGHAYKSKLWSVGQTITVSLMLSRPSSWTETHKQRARDAVTEWTTYANLNYVWLDDPRNAMIRIDNDNGKANYSYLGTDNLKIKFPAATMNIRNPWRNIFLHEFGHALGLIHEHQSDRGPTGAIKWNMQAVYEYFGGAPNFMSRAQIHYWITNVASRDSTVGTDRDPLSIMHYRIPQELTLDDYEVHSNQELSAGDKAFVRSIYPYPDEPEEPPVSVDAPQQLYDADGVLWYQRP